MDKKGSWGLAMLTIILVGICWGVASLMIYVFGFGGEEEPINTSENEYIELTVSFLAPNNEDITKYYLPKLEKRIYYCKDVAEDYWRYPSYDNAFNKAYEYCNLTFPEMFKKEAIPYNEEDWGNGTLFYSTNLSIANYEAIFSESDITIYNVHSNIKLINMSCELIRCPNQCEGNICYAVQCLECGDDDA